LSAELDLVVLDPFPKIARGNDVIVLQHKEFHGNGPPECLQSRFSTHKAAQGANDLSFGHRSKLINEPDDEASCDALTERRPKKNWAEHVWREQVVVQLRDGLIARVDEYLDGATIASFGA